MQFSLKCYNKFTSKWIVTIITNYFGCVLRVGYLFCLALNCQLKCFYHRKTLFMELWLYTFEGNSNKICLEDNSFSKTLRLGNNLQLKIFNNILTLFISIFLYKCKTLTEMSNSNLQGLLDGIFRGFPQSTS